MDAKLIKLHITEQEAMGGGWREESGFTVQRGARRAAGQAWDRTTAAALLRCQLLFNLFQASTLLETAHAIHHTW